MRILIIEQETIIAEDIKNTLQNFRYEVVDIAKSNNEALKKYFVKEPDLIVSDSRLETDFGGIEFAVKLQGINLVPFVFITPHKLELITKKASAIKYFDSVRMPFSFDELIQKIELVYYYSQSERIKEKISNDLSKMKSNDGEHIIENRMGNYVSPSRIEELKAIKTQDFDLSKLIKLCEELNYADLNKCYFTIGILIRSVIDHIPPLFRKSTFSEIANNYKGDKSFKDLMLRLDKSQRLIADRHLHSQISKKEILPSFNQINFKAEIDVLLGEIIKILH